MMATLVMGLASTGVAASEPPAPDPQAGKAAYDQHCARCHGDAGRGDGVDAKRFYPRPRDLTLGVYKFRSTASGAPPSDEDLFRTITQGLPGTNMPDWQHLDEATRWQLVYYLKGLSPVFEGPPPAPVVLPPDPGHRRADRAKGRQVFEQLGCAACHGSAGRANGPSAAGLVDDWGMPLRPANLTHGWAYRGGGDPGAIATRIMAGIDGAGMPSYAEALSGDDVWHLAYYVASLQEPVHWNMIAHPLRLEGALPESPEDPRWARAEPTDLPMRNVVTAQGEWAQPPTIRLVSVRAAYNAEEIALLVSWDDPTQDDGDPADGLAVLLKPAGLLGDVATLQAWPYEGAPRLDACRWSAGGGASEVVTQRVEEIVRPAEAGRQPLQSASAYLDGRWRLVLRRPLHPAQPAEAAAIDRDGFTAVAVMAWDGGNAPARAVSPWIDLAILD
jgi:cytochrome c oxidase cbb3-type subunit 2